MTEPTGFREFWALYPRRVGKGAAVKAWTKLKPSAEIQQQIAVALEWQVHQPSWVKDGGSFIPYPATWLNRWQWEDERPIVQQRPSYEWACPHTPQHHARHACYVQTVLDEARAERARL